jgi:hypothetical protein
LKKQLVTMAAAVAIADASAPTAVNLPSIARFNRAYFDFIRAARSCSPAIARTLTQTYGTLDKLSPAYLEHFEAQFPVEDWDADMLAGACGAPPAASSSPWGDRLVFDGISLSELADAAAHKSWTSAALLQHLGALHLFRLLHARGEDDWQTKRVLTLLDSSATPDDGSTTSDSARVELDKDLSAALEALLASVATKNPTADAEQPPPAAGTNPSTTGFTDSDADALLEGTQLGRLAKDISERLDLASLGAETPEGLMGLLSAGGGGSASSPGGGGLSKVIEQVSGVLAEKFQSGEVNHMDLIRDAMTLAGRFASMPSSSGPSGAGSGGLPDLVSMAMRTLGSTAPSSSASASSSGPMADLVAQFAAGLTDFKGSGSGNRGNNRGIDKNRRSGRKGRGRAKK